MNICSTLFCRFMSRYFGLRWIWTVSVTSLGVTGAALMLWIPQSDISGE